MLEKYWNNSRDTENTEKSRKMLQKMAYRPANNHASPGEAFEGILGFKVGNFTADRTVVALDGGFSVGNLMENM